MRSGLLNGREHTLVGGFTAIAEGPTAVALSIGGAKKQYSHKDPNEDAAAFADGPGGTLIAVADGHGGYQAAEIAISELLRVAAPMWTGSGSLNLRPNWHSEACGVLFDLNTAILEAALKGAPNGARTTLAMILVRPDDGLLAYLSIGDSHIFHVGATEVVDLAFERRKQSFYLGSPSETQQTLEERCVAGCEDLAETRAIVLATDGFTEVEIGVDHPEAAIIDSYRRAAQAKPDLRPLHAARSVMDLALASHRQHRSGDNIACGVLWMHGGSVDLAPQAAVD
ncbi:MAG: protein phosphatase 2C domain-containing protein [Myxococcales bacterium]|nr:protein phosphatase 2C domain-containing protein [Myxococcales bacterium]